MTIRSRVAVAAGHAPERLRNLVPPDQRADLRHWLGRYLPWEQGVDLEPPPLLPGEVTGPPDFVGVGVQEAGSAWWYRLVTDHPMVSHRAPFPMARHHLSHFSTAPFAPPEIDRYHRWFPRRPGTQTGEWTPSYLGQPWVAPLIALAAPHAKILLMVRDPVDRLGRVLDRRRRSRGEHVGWHRSDAVDRGFYAASLRDLHQHVDPQRVLVLQYEQCVADPAGSLAATYRFLGLEAEHRPAPALLRRPPIVAPPEFDLDTATRLVEMYAADVSDLAALVPTLDLSLWPAFADMGLDTTGR